MLNGVVVRLDVDMRVSTFKKGDKYLAYITFELL